MIKIIVRLESVFIVLVSAYFYTVLNGNLLLFILLGLTLDVSMIGHLKDKKLGATTYNLVHNYALGLGIFLIDLISSNYRKSNLYTFLECLSCLF